MFHGFLCVVFLLLPSMWLWTVSSSLTTANRINKNQSHRDFGAFDSVGWFVLRLVRRYRGNVTLDKLLYSTSATPPPPTPMVLLPAIIYVISVKKRKTLLLSFAASMGWGKLEIKVAYVVNSAFTPTKSIQNVHDTRIGRVTPLVTVCTFFFYKWNLTSSLTLRNCCILLTLSSFQQIIK